MKFGDSGNFLNYSKNYHITMRKEILVLVGIVDLFWKLPLSTAAFKGNSPWENN